MTQRSESAPTRPHPGDDPQSGPPDGGGAPATAPERGTPAPRADPGTWLLVLNAVLLAGFLVWLPLRPDNKAATALVGDLAYMVFFLSLVIMTWRASRARGLSARGRIGWRLIALGGGSYLIGNAFWFYFEVVKGIVAPFPSLADLGYLGFYPPILAGIAFLVRPLENRAEQHLFWLDLGVVASGAGTLVWYFLLLPIALDEHESTLALVIAEAYPMSAIVLLVGVTALVLRPWDDRPVAPIGWLGAGLLAYFVGDIRYAYETLTTVYASGGLTDAFYHLAAVLIMVGAWLDSRGGAHSEQAGRGPLRPERVLAVLPYLSVAAVFGLLLPVAFGWSFDPLEGAGRTALAGLVLGAVVIAVLIMARQSVAARELARLQDERAARLAAEAASRAKTEFLALMSHEIRTPLNVVLGLAQVLERGVLRPDQRDMLERIRAAGQSLLAIINDILDLSKIEAGRLHVESGEFELEPLLAQVDSLMGQTAREKGLRLVVHPPPAPLGPLLGDRQRLEQVLMNLLGNAIKFTVQGQVDLVVQARAGEGWGLWLRCEVRDTGIGIAPAALTRLFTPFTQADAGITRRFGGTGLGLSLSKRLVELMGGEIGVTSEPGAGSNFWFEVPLVRATAQGERPPAAAAPAPRSPPGARLLGLRVLVVDDSAMNRDLVERALGQEGASAILVADGRQAVEVLRAKPGDFAAVLMDVRMPVMDGLSATRLIRTELGLTRLPIIAVTAGVLAEELETARAAGMNAILAKPLDLERMTEVLLQWAGPRDAAAAGPAPPAPVAREPAAAAVGSDGFPEIAGLDRSRTAATLRGDRALFLRVLERFTDEHAAAVAETREALAAGEREQAARRLHTLRGDAGYLGALDLMAEAEALEQAITSGAPRVEDGLAALAARVDMLIESGRAWLGGGAPGGTAASGPAATPTLDATRLATLRAALSSNQLVALTLMNELAPALAGLLGQRTTEALRHAIHGLQFRQALELLDRSAPDADRSSGQKL